jgi:voltage-gated potassium channel
MARLDRFRTYELLGDDSARSPARSAVAGFLLLAIVISGGATVLGTLPSLAPGWNAVLSAVKDAALIVFTLEYGLRLWIAPESIHHHAPNVAKARLAYARSFLGAVDLLVIVPYWLDLILSVGNEAVIVGQLLVALKLARYSPGLVLFVAVFRNERRTLLSELVVLSVLLLLASGLMYLIEHPAQPDVFVSIPHSLWWGIVTMATVGYGDMTPITPLGRILAGFVMLLGIAMIAVPAGILATGFGNEIRKRDFMVNSRTIAQLPLFAGLDASHIAEITRVLRPQAIPANSAIVRKGERADAMFFIVAGEVEVDVKPKPVVLGKGDFFGEIALLRDIERTATVTAITDCQLLALFVRDFGRLMEQFPNLKTALAREAERRMGEQPPKPEPQPER